MNRERVSRSRNRRGVARRAEREIHARGHRVARLSVIAINSGARRFYARHGWIEAREFISERFEVRKIEMTKLLS